MLFTHKYVQNRNLLVRLNDFYTALKFITLVIKNRKNVYMLQSFSKFCRIIGKNWHNCVRCEATCAILMRNKHIPKLSRSNVELMFPNWLIFRVWYKKSQLSQRNRATFASCRERSFVQKVGYSASVHTILEEVHWRWTIKFIIALFRLYKS